MGFSEPVKVWHHQKYGEGPRVFVGLHGWNGSHRSFDSLLPYLPDDVTFYALDLPGYGGSSPPNSWSLSGIVSALQEQLAALDLPAFTLVGSCSGALFGMWAMREPSPFLVERVVLIDAFASCPGIFVCFSFLVSAICFTTRPLPTRWAAGLRIGRCETKEWKIRI